MTKTGTRKIGGGDLVVPTKCQDQGAYLPITTLMTRMQVSKRLHL